MAVVWRYPASSQHHADTGRGPTGVRCARFLSECSGPKAIQGFLKKAAAQRGRRQDSLSNLSLAWSLGRSTLAIGRNPNCSNGPFLGALGAPGAAVFASEHFQLPTPGRFGVTAPTVSCLACVWRVACGHMSREFKSNQQSSPGQQNAAQTGGSAAQLTCRGMGLTMVG